MYDVTNFTITLNKVDGSIKRNYNKSWVRKLRMNSLIHTLNLGIDLSSKMNHFLSNGHKLLSFSLKPTMDQDQIIV
jgi:hypothetical protein